MALPIWKDYNIDLGTGESMYYRIRLGTASGKIIYSGRAFKRPGDESIAVRINDICADYISQTLPTLSEEEFAALTKPLTFFVQTSADGSAWASVAQVRFFNDWSYDYNFDAETQGMCHPINGKIDRHMWIPYTSTTGEDKAIEVDGVAKTLPIAVDPSFEGTSFARSAESCGAGTAVFSIGKGNKVQIDDIVFEVVTECAEYALYYVNAYGGMDAFLIEGNAVERDAVTRRTRGVDYSNERIENRGEQNYLNEVTKEWTLYTGLLSDAESLAMHHLFNSPEVYLYDIVTGEMMPVVITSDMHDHKTYRNQGHQRVRYEIGVRLAQERMRR